MKSLSITSGKGGVGKTNVAVNLALALADRGRRVLILDADLGLANIDILLGLRTQHTLYDVIAGTHALSDVVLRVRERVDLLPANSGVLRLERLTPDEHVRLATDLDALSDAYDVLLIDTGAGIGENVLFFNDLADQVLLVTVPEPTALTDTYAMIKILARTYGVEKMSVVINQAASEAAAATVHAKLSDVSRKFLGVEVELAGILPNDAAVPASVQARTAALSHNPNTAFSRAIRNLATSIEPRLGEGTPKRERGLWREWMTRTRGGRTLRPMPLTPHRSADH